MLRADQEDKRAGKKISGKIETSKETEALVGWLVQEKTLKGFGWLVSWAERGEWEEDGVARKREEVTGKRKSFPPMSACTGNKSQGGERTEEI